MRGLGAIVLVAALTLAPMTGISWAQQHPALDFSARPDLPDAFAASVAARYAAPISSASALADFHAAGMRCSANIVRTCADPTNPNSCTDSVESIACSKTVTVNRCVYRFSAIVVGADVATVTGNAESDCYD